MLRESSTKEGTYPLDLRGLVRHQRIDLACATSAERPEGAIDGAGRPRPIPFGQRSLAWAHSRRTERSQAAVTVDRCSRQFPNDEPCFGCSRNPRPISIRRSQMNSDVDPAIVRRRSTAQHEPRLSKHRHPGWIRLCRSDWLSGISSQLSAAIRWRCLHSGMTRIHAERSGRLRESVHPLVAPSGLIADRSTATSGHGW